MIPHCQHIPGWVPELPDVPRPRGVSLQLGDARAERGDVRGPDLQSIRQGQQREPGLSCGDILTSTLHWFKPRILHRNFWNWPSSQKRDQLKTNYPGPSRCMTRTCQVKVVDVLWRFCICFAGTITATEMLEVIGTVITMEGLNEVLSSGYFAQLLKI